jgi:Tfp pilus assembly protein PilO
MNWIVLARRVVTEKRSLVLPLVVVAAGNIALYGLLLYPLEERVRNAEERAAGVERTLQQAEAEHLAASRLLAGREAAGTALDTFYGQVLPLDLAGARRITYRRLDDLARGSNVRSARRESEQKAERDSDLQRLEMTMVVEGEYRDVRQFIHELERSPEFLVIENMALSQGIHENAPLVLTISLTTFFRTENNGT